MKALAKFLATLPGESKILGQLIEKKQKLGKAGAEFRDIMDVNDDIIDMLRKRLVSPKDYADLSTQIKKHMG